MITHSSKPLTLLILLALAFQVISHASNQQSMVKYPVTYGSLFKLFSEPNSRYMHSHQIRFGRGGIYSVTGYPHDDQGNYWQVLQQYPYHTKTYSEVVKCGDVIRLRSAIIGYNVRIDETSFGLTTELLPMVHGVFDSQSDAAINWKIKCMDKEVGDTLYYGDVIKLKHSVTGKYIFLDPSSQYTEFNCGRGCQIMRQIQLHGVEDDSQDDKTMFKVLGGLAFEANTKEEATE